MGTVVSNRWTQMPSDRRLLPALLAMRIDLLLPPIVTVGAFAVGLALGIRLTEKTPAYFPPNETLNRRGVVCHWTDLDTGRAPVAQRLKRVEPDGVK